MSYMEDNLQEIANAIREKEETTEPIPAEDFADRIRSLSSGVKSFNGRTGEVTPEYGDYTAEMVGALSLSGGTMEGRIITTEGLTASSGTNPSAILKPTARGFSATVPTYGADAVILSNDAASAPTFEFRFAKASGSLYAAPVILQGIADPKGSYDAVNKSYVDELVGNIGELLDIFNGEVA